MTALDLPTVLNAAYKLNDWLNFYWTFYVVFTGVVIGWVFNSKGWSSAQRAVVTLFYLGFVAVSLGALMKTYQTLNAAASRLEALLPNGDVLSTALVSQLANPDWKLQLALHIAGDVLVLACIWLFTKKPPEPAAEVAGRAPRA